MQPLSSGPYSTDGSLSESSSSTITKSTGRAKRGRKVVEEDKTVSTSQIDRPAKIQRIDGGSSRKDISQKLHDASSLQDGNRIPDKLDDNKGSSCLGSLHVATEILNNDQKTFVRHWHDTFAKFESLPVLSNEFVSALAILTQARPQLIFEYIRELCPDISEPNDTPIKECLDSTFPKQNSSPGAREPFSLSTTNEHLPPTTLHLVTKYISVCRRTRPRNDGRRSVNIGPYRCTFGCGYCTKRAFDWRRHEETHEPQELWLCSLCHKPNTKTDDQKDAEGSKREPFLVSRKDKFLQHAKECHKDWPSEKGSGP